MVIFGIIQWWHRSFNSVDWLAFGCMYALFSHFFYSDPRDYDLEMDDDGIRQLRNGMVRRTLQRDRIRYVREWNDGKNLVISEHGPVWTRLLWGGIAVPKSVSDYDEIKARTLGWLQQATNARMVRPTSSNS
jgi:hypothetical protein